MKAEIVTTRQSDPPSKSVAFLVDDLVTWMAAGRALTGLQRVVLGLLDTAYRRTDIRGWPAVSDGGLTVGQRRALVEVAPDTLRFDAFETEPSAGIRLLRLARRTAVAMPMPLPVRRFARAANSQLSFAFEGFRGQSKRPDESADLLVVPGAFWSGDTAHCIDRLAREKLPIRLLVHDLIPMRHPEWFPSWFSREFEQAMGRVVPQADRIVTLSQDVADAVADQFPSSAGRIRVTVPTFEAHAPNVGAKEVAQQQARVAGPFLLAIGTVEPRKNHRAILEAWREAKRDSRLEGASLVVVGRRAAMAEDIESEIARDSDRLRIVRLDHVTDEMLNALYRDCVATVHASWAEGFGLPARESVVRGIPTLVSTAIPRDGLPGGTYRAFDPTNAPALAHLMVETILDGYLRRPVSLGAGTGWEPVLAALVDD